MEICFSAFDSIVSDDSCNSRFLVSCFVAVISLFQLPSPSFCYCALQFAHLSLLSLARLPVLSDIMICGSCSLPLSDRLPHEFSLNILDRERECTWTRNWSRNGADKNDWGSGSATVRPVGCVPNVAPETCDSQKSGLKACVCRICWSEFSFKV